MQLTQLITYLNIQLVPNREHFTSPLQTSKLILFGETDAVHCENQRNTIYKNLLRTSQETHCFSAPKLKWLMLFTETSLFIVRTIRSTQKQHNSDLITVEASGTYGNHGVLKGYPWLRVSD
jgi:hypothetical protein